MAKKTFQLTDAVARKLAKPGLHNDGDGLNLRITDNGTKSWILRFKRGLTENGKPRGYSMGLGPYPAVSLAEAREAANGARALLRQGINPLDERRRQMQPTEVKHVVTFDEAARRYIAAHEASWRNAKHRQQWANTLTTYASPVIGGKDVAAISSDDVLRILEPIWQAKPETASRVRGRVENVLDWAKARKLREGENPAMWKGGLKHLLPARKKLATVRHHPAMPWREMGAFMTELRANTSMSSLALQFTILTCVRTSEGLEARWPEIDERERVWTVPAKRMKGGHEHRVPLTGAALTVLAGLLRIDGNPYLFPGARPLRPLSNMAMLELLRGMRPGLTVHGFRSTFRDWVAEMTSFPRELAEVALAHIVGNAVERAYQRGDLFEKRRKLMKGWADFCDHATPEGAVIPLGSKRNR